MRSLLVAVALLILIPALPQTQSASVRVATREVRPFVFRQGDQLTGFSIELWQEIGRRLGFETQFVVKPTVQDLLESVKSKESDLAISAVSITAEREQVLDLSQPMFDAGLQILTPAVSSGGLLNAFASGVVVTSAALPILAGVV